MKFAISDLLEVTAGIGMLSALARSGFNGFVVGFLIAHLLLLSVPALVLAATLTSIHQRGRVLDVKLIPCYGLLKKTFLVAIVCVPIVWGVLFLKIWAA